MLWTWFGHALGLLLALSLLWALSGQDLVTIEAKFDGREMLSILNT